LAPAQTAIASADAYAEQKFAATVAYINPGVDITKASVEVKLNVTTPPDYLRQDMTVSVDIDVGESKSALLLPSRSVNDQLTQSPWVLLIKNGRATRQPVTTGLQDSAQVEIKRGVAEGDLVIPMTAGVSVGGRVRAVGRTEKEKS
jgi:HlyD family secretion protein